MTALLDVALAYVPAGRRRTFLRRIRKMAT